MGLPGGNLGREGGRGGGGGGVPQAASGVPGRAGDEEPARNGSREHAAGRPNPWVPTPRTPVPARMRSQSEGFLAREPTWAPTRAPHELPLHRCSTAAALRGEKSFLGIAGADAFLAGAARLCQGAGCLGRERCAKSEESYGFPENQTWAGEKNPMLNPCSS